MAASSENSLQGRTIAFLIAPEGTEQVELTEPWKAVSEAGGRPVLISTKDGEAQLFNHLDKGDTRSIDVTVDGTSPLEYDGLVLPGGVANPDFLRTQAEAVRFAWQFFNSGKPVAAICHAPWLLVEAAVVRDRTLTSWPSLRTDVVNAGGTWVDEETVICEKGPNTLLTSRKPDDLPAFNRAMVELMAR